MLKMCCIVVTVIQVEPSLSLLLWKKSQISFQSWRLYFWFDKFPWFCNSSAARGKRCCSKKICALSDRYFLQPYRALSQMLPNQSWTQSKNQCPSSISLQMIDFYILLIFYRIRIVCFAVMILCLVEIFCMSCWCQLFLLLPGLRFIAPLGETLQVGGPTVDPRCYWTNKG